MLDIGFSAAGLRALGFTDELVDRIMRFLDTSAADLNGSKPDSVVQAAFGTSPAGSDCATQANKARQYVVEAISDMVTGLHGYHSSLDGMRRRAHQVDETTESDINRLIVRSESCTATPTVATPNQCGPIPSTQGSGS